MFSAARQEKVKTQLDNLTRDKLKVCVVRGKCACTGCVNALGVTSRELKWYKDTYEKS